MEPVWKASKSGTMFEPWDLDGFMLFLGRFAEGEELEIVVRKPRKPSSTAQMRYYYGVVCKVLSEYTGHTPDEVDSAMKWMFLRRQNKGMEYVPSKSDLTTVEMEEYVEKIRQWALVGLDCHIPLPNEVDINEDEAVH